LVASQTLSKQIKAVSKFKAKQLACIRRSSQAIFMLNSKVRVIMGRDWFEEFIR
jgi:hypothetical protein